MALWEIEYTDEFGMWWDAQDGDVQVAVDASVRLLELLGPALPFPHSSGVRGGRHGRLRELRIQCNRRPIRILYAFDPRRTAILLTGGAKTGTARWYEESIRRADALYETHLAGLTKEGSNDGT